MAGGQYAVVITKAPPAGGFLAKLLGGGPQVAVAKAIESFTAMPIAQAKRKLERLPVEIARFSTEQEAKVAAQTIEDAGARCEVRAV